MLYKRYKLYNEGVDFKGYLTSITGATGCIRLVNIVSLRFVIAKHLRSQVYLVEVDKERGSDIRNEESAHTNIYRSDSAHCVVLPHVI